MRRTSVISKGWQFANESWLKAPGYLGCSALEWLPAEVPGHVHLDLARNGVIPNPLSERHELGCQWVDGETWVYSAEFETAHEPGLPHRRLRFGGLDTVCEVYLNEELIACHDNMFVPLEVNVDERLRAGRNSLKVRFLPAACAGETRRAEYFAAQGLPSDLVRFEERAFVRKAPYMFGWDWGPRLISAGIWKPVELDEFEARIVDVHVQQVHEAESVHLRCVSTIEGAGKVVHFLQPPGEQPPQTIEEGLPLTLHTPQLWWPAGFGAQALHHLHSFLLRSDSNAQTFEHCERECLDRRSTQIGLRTVQLVQEPDAWGRSFRFQVNGRPIWCVGANWIPDHSFPSQVTRTRLEARLQSVVEMNMNMLRVWGGGVYESDEFYDLCDRAGILVWQDFPFACSYSPDDDAALAVVEREAQSEITRLRNRASLAIWCGNNENLMMFQAKWDDSSKHPPRCHGERIWEESLPRLIEDLDPGRVYIPTSPHSPSAEELANSDLCGDQHNWDVWHGRGDWMHYRSSRARFASEYGFASAPSMLAWREVFGDRDVSRVDVRDPVARWHDKTKKGYETFIGFVELHYRRAADLEEWTYVSQLNQRDALCAAIEHYRRSQFCSGSLIWQLNDCWPVQSWSVLDNTGTKKAAAFALGRLYAPCLATIVVDRERRCAEVHAVLDNSVHRRQELLSLETRDVHTGRLLHAWEQTVDLEPGERKLVMTLDLSAFEPSRTVLWCDFAGSETYRLLCEPNELDTVSPAWTVHTENNVLVLNASGPILDLWVQLRGAEVDRNFVSLRQPGMVRLNTSGPSDHVQLYWIGGKASLTIQT